MDKQFTSSVKYNEYYNNQIENHVDLTNEKNDSVKNLAQILFSKNPNNLDTNLIGLLLDDIMDTLDIHTMLLELVLHGLEILYDGNYTIFDLPDASNDIVFLIKRYMQSIGINMNIVEDFSHNEDTRIFNSEDCVYRILRKPNITVDIGWILYNYLIIQNTNIIKFDNQLCHYKTFFITNEYKKFTIQFNFENKYI